MSRKRLLLLAVVAALGVAACETYGPTPYKAAESGSEGYKETRIESDRYRISFKGNSLTERETVENYMLFRAAELTLQEGYDHFTIVDRDIDKRSRLRESGGYASMRLSYVYFHPRVGWVSAWDPFWTPSTFREVTRYEAVAEIRLGKGPKGSDPGSFDAREVSKNLASAITRPPQ